MQETSRREFLSRTFFFLGGLIAAALALPSAVYFLSPAWRRKQEGWIEIGPVSSIPIGRPTKVEFIERTKDAWATIEGKRSAWIVTSDGKTFDSFDPHCTHLGCPYSWSEEKEKFLCPCHNAAFAIDGRVLFGPPPRPLDRYRSKVENGLLYILPEAEPVHG